MSKDIPFHTKFYGASETHCQSILQKKKNTRGWIQYLAAIDYLVQSSMTNTWRRHLHTKASGPQVNPLHNDNRQYTIPLVKRPIHNVQANEKTPNAIKPKTQEKHFVPYQSTLIILHFHLYPQCLLTQGKG